MRPEYRVDAMLDHALEMTFPASDPFTVYFPEAEPAAKAAPAEQEPELEVAPRADGRRRPEVRKYESTWKENYDEPIEYDA